MEGKGQEGKGKGRDRKERRKGETGGPINNNLSCVYYYQPILIRPICNVVINGSFLDFAETFSSVVVG